jgi:hypothetical protein
MRVPPAKLPTTYPVKGKVFLDGKPLSAGTVILHPAKDKGYRAEGSLKSDGTFEVSAFPDRTGTVPGAYIVTIVPESYVDAKAPKGTAAGKASHSDPKKLPPVPVKYLSPDSSGLEVTVEQHETDVGTLKLVTEKTTPKKK